MKRLVMAFVAQAASVALVAVALILSAGELEAQILSPGKLAEPHAHLEGLRQCTVCHELGQRGISPERCLECHTPLSSRIEAGRGFHASVTGQTCSDCHIEHYGRDFELRRLDTSAFVHADTGYDLEGGHTDAECADCHTSEHIDAPDVVDYKTEHESLDRTYLGVSRFCVTCHETDSPHEGQFEGRSCEDCHDAESWEEAPRFEHRLSAYPLDGRHLQVDCSECHVPSAGFVTFAPLEYRSCDSCHQDPHEGGMSGTCVSCHRTDGWREVSRASLEGVFDHSGTAFPLVEAHAAAECEACHTSGRPPIARAIRITYQRGTAGYTFPRPVSDGCAACHVPYHPADQEDALSAEACSDCHSESAWTPTTYRVVRHNDEADFALTGAHTATPCIVCHVQMLDRGAEPWAHSAPQRFVLGLARSECAACHEEESPHEDLFGTQTCDECHNTDVFEMDDFDHDADGVQRVVETCTTCHAEDDPHQDQFGDRQCGTCHVTTGYAITDFDHDVTAYPLDGAHEPAECSACHSPERAGDGRDFIRYRPLGRECTDCHGVSP